MTFPARIARVVVSTAAAAGILFPAGGFATVTAAPTHAQHSTGNDTMTRARSTDDTHPGVCVITLRGDEQRALHGTYNTDRAADAMISSIASRLRGKKKFVTALDYFVSHQNAYRQARKHAYESARRTPQPVASYTQQMKHFISSLGPGYETQGITPLTAALVDEGFTEAEAQVIAPHIAVSIMGDGLEFFLRHRLDLLSTGIDIGYAVDHSMLGFTTHQLRGGKLPHVTIASPRTPEQDRDTVYRALGLRFPLHEERDNDMVSRGRATATSHVLGTMSAAARRDAQQGINDKIDRCAAQLRADQRAGVVGPEFVDWGTVDGVMHPSPSKTPDARFVPEGNPLRGLATTLVAGGVLVGVVVIAVVVAVLFFIARSMGLGR